MMVADGYVEEKAPAHALPTATRTGVNTATALQTSPSFPCVNFEHTLTTNTHNSSKESSRTTTTTPTITSSNDQDSASSSSIMQSSINAPSCGLAVSSGERRSDEANSRRIEDVSIRPCTSPRPEEKQEAVSYEAPQLRSSQEVEVAESYVNSPALRRERKRTRESLIAAGNVSEGNEERHVASAVSTHDNGVADATTNTVGDRAAEESAALHESGPLSAAGPPAPTLLSVHAAQETAADSQRAGLRTAVAASANVPVVAIDWRLQHQQQRPYLVNPCVLSSRERAASTEIEENEEAHRLQHTGEASPRGFSHMRQPLQEEEIFGTTSATATAAGVAENEEEAFASGERVSVVPVAAPAEPIDGGVNSDAALAALGSDAAVAGGSDGAAPGPTVAQCEGSQHSAIKGGLLSSSQAAAPAEEVPAASTMEEGVVADGCGRVTAESSAVPNGNMLSSSSALLTSESQDIAAAGRRSSNSIPPSSSVTSSSAEGIEKDLVADVSEGSVLADRSRAIDERNKTAQMTCDSGLDNQCSRETAEKRRFCKGVERAQNSRDGDAGGDRSSNEGPCGIAISTSSNNSSGEDSSRGDNSITETCEAVNTAGSISDDSIQSYSNISNSGDPAEVGLYAASVSTVEGSSNSVVVVEGGGREAAAEGNGELGEVTPRTSRSSSSRMSVIVQEIRSEVGGLRERTEREGSDVEEVLARPGSPISVADDDEDDVAVITAAATAAAVCSPPNLRGASERQRQQAQTQESREQAQRRGDGADEFSMSREASSTRLFAADGARLPAASLAVRPLEGEEEEAVEESELPWREPVEDKQQSLLRHVAHALATHRQEGGAAGAATVGPPYHAFDLLASDDEEQHQQLRRQGRSHVLNKEENDDNGSPSVSSAVESTGPALHRARSSRSRSLRRRRLSTSSSNASVLSSVEPTSPGASEAAGGASVGLHDTRSNFASGSAVAADSTVTETGAAGDSGTADSAATAAAAHTEGERPGGAAAAAWNAARRLPQRLRMRFWPTGGDGPSQGGPAASVAAEQGAEEEQQQRAQQQHDREGEEAGEEGESVATSEDDEVEILAPSGATRDTAYEVETLSTSGVGRRGGSSTSDIARVTERTAEEEDVEVVMVRESLPQARLLSYTFGPLATTGRCLAARTPQQRTTPPSDAASAAQGFSRLLTHQLTEALSRSGLFFWGGGGGDGTSGTDTGRSSSAGLGAGASTTPWASYGGAEGGGSTRVGGSRAATGAGGNMFFSAAAIVDEDDDEDTSSSRSSSAFVSKDVENAPRCTICLLNLKRRHEEMLRLIEQRDKEEEQLKLLQQQQQESATAAGDDSSSGSSASDTSATDTKHLQEQEEASGTIGEGGIGISGGRRTLSSSSSGESEGARATTAVGELQQQDNRTDESGAGVHANDEYERATQQQHQQHQSEALEQRETQYHTGSARSGRRGGRVGNSRDQRAAGAGSGGPLQASSSSATAAAAATGPAVDASSSTERASIQPQQQSETSFAGLQQQQQQRGGGGGSSSTSGRAKIYPSSPPRGQQREGSSSSKGRAGGQQQQQSSRRAAWIAERFKAMYSGDDLRQPVVTVCGHVFCQGCLLPALQLKRECPVCRRKLTGPRQFFPIFF